MFDALGDLEVGHPQGPAQAGQIGETFVYGVFFHLRCIAPNNGKKALGQQAIGFVVGRQDHRLWAHFPDLRQPHAARHPARLRLIAHRGGDTALFAGDHRPPLELWAARLLARGEKRIAINMKDGAGKGTQTERRLQG
jgi:hypothetical protein